MILSRVADGLYWVGRYLERAENTARLLLVTEELSTEVLGLDEALAREEWKDLRAVFPGFPEDDRDPRALTGFAAASLLGLSVDPDNPYSVFHSLKKARDNARSVREALTLEVFINLNETYRELEAQNPGQLADPAAFRSALTSTQRGIMSTVGAIEHTLTRDAGWLFLKLGEALERVFRTVIILRVKLPALVAAEPKIDLPLFYSRWRSLLRGLSCLENYRRVFAARLEPIEEVVCLRRVSAQLVCDHVVCARRTILLQNGQPVLVRAQISIVKRDSAGARYTPSLSDGASYVANGNEFEAICQ